MYSLLTNTVSWACLRYSGEQFKRYRDVLLSCGFTESIPFCGRFFRKATENTAFIINLMEKDAAGIVVLYGFDTAPNFIETE